MSNEPLRRTGSYAAATITAALVIWATTGSNVLQSLFLSMSYAVYRALRGHRWLTVHRKQLYQRLSLPPVVQRSPAAISCRLHLLPPPSAPAASLERSSGTCRTQASPSPSNNRGTIVMSGRNNSKSWELPGVSWPLEGQRRHRRRLNALHYRRRRRRRRRPSLQSSTKPRLNRCRVVSVQSPRTTSRIIEATCPLPRPRRPCLHSPCMFPLGQSSTQRITIRPTAHLVRLLWVAGFVNPQLIDIGGATTLSLWREIAPLEPNEPVNS